ncbi:Methyltransferase domain-containing protein [Halomicrobium zhouii]|uniref:Methyltransferase domain-containing protein n=1 Tax=Halomicrobium zhouii TaxID=767519 RepID=A0A1I6M3U3_9EURY|nr:class I SAM-dependent methyltransferase [Halomicrobium zhouii]SFS10308.1 Methyltransferase domain-containing protein [Halomicrobium zhouii]
MEPFENTGQPDWDWWGKLWPTPGATLRELGVESGDALAEVGCGNGYFALPAARVVDPAPVYACDLDESLLTECSALADRQGVDNVEPVHGDARRLSELLPEPVDVVLLANAFHGVDDRDALVREVEMSLCPGGRFVVVNWHARPREETTVADEPRGPPSTLRMTPDETTADVLGAADFSLDERIALPPYHYALAFER